MILTIKNAQACGVLAALYSMLGDKAGELVIESYHNGREEGFSIYARARLGRIAVFSENRNSDQIVVYTGDITDFDISSGIANEETYRRRRFFDWLDFKSAAEAVIDYLRLKD